MLEWTVGPQSALGTRELLSYCYWPMVHTGAIVAARVTRAEAHCGKCMPLAIEPSSSRERCGNAG